MEWPKDIHNPISETSEHIMLHGMWQEGIKVAHRIKIANQLTLRRGNYPRLSMWAHCNHRVLIDERSTQGGQGQSQRERVSDAM